MGFPRQKHDGTTSLAILVPGEGIDPKRPKERPVSLGQIIGKVQKGVGHLDQYHEDLRNIAKPVKPLNYGAFGSYAPSYDSSFSTISKDETNLIYGYYSTETQSAMHESILNCCKDYDYPLTMVDNILDLLTKGEHKKTIKPGELAETKDSEETPGPSGTQQPSSKVDVAQLKTLADLGIDVTFLNDFDEKMEVESDPVQVKLDESSTYIKKLQDVQTKRLSAPLPAHLSRVSQPTELELMLAEKVTGHLTEITKMVQPEALISIKSIRKAMGVDIPNE